MTTPQSAYNVVSQVQVNQWDDALQRAVAGTRYTVRDGQTRQVVQVFVPTDDYSVDAVRQAIEDALAPVREIAKLGQ